MANSYKVYMQGGGIYNANCPVQELAVDKSFELFDPIEFDGASITLADYGCSEGGNSAKLLHKYLSRLRSISSAIMIYNDTPSNDFSSLSLTLDENRFSASQNEKLQVYSLMIPKSYYQQVVPNEFVDVGFSFTTLHWFQERPAMCKDTSDESKLASSAHNDLVAFLSVRYQELRQGGHLILCIPTKGSVSVIPALRCLVTAVRRLSGDFHFSPEAFSQLPLYFRTMEEILSAVKDTKGKWRVKKSTEIAIEHPSWSLVNDIKGSEHTNESRREKYASDVTGFILAALSGFAWREVKSKMETTDEMETGNGRAEEAEFMKRLAAEFKEEFLRSHCDEIVGFTYAFLNLEKQKTE